MGKFRQILTELSARETHVFSCPDDNLSKYLVHALRRSGFGLLMGELRQCLIELSARDMIMAGY